MSYTGTLVLVLLAAFGLTNVLLSILVAVICHTGLDRKCKTSSTVLALRLLPVGGAALLTLTVVLPAFLVFEPVHEFEAVGPMVVTLALLSLITAGTGCFRGCRAYAATRSLIRRIGTAGYWREQRERPVALIDHPKPLVAVIGGWRPRIFAARQVFAACSQEEFRQIIAHEAAHVSARDNLKLLLLVASPDVLAWLPAGKALATRWRVMAEFEADERAAGSDRRKRVALASALVKVARLAAGTEQATPAISMSIAADDLAGRVHQLLAVEPQPVPPTGFMRLLAPALLVPIVSVPTYQFVHHCIEALVAFGS